LVFYIELLKKIMVIILEIFLSVNVEDNTKHLNIYK
jgi:hypothetical protein